MPNNKEYPYTLVGKNAGYISVPIVEPGQYDKQTVGVVDDLMTSGIEGELAFRMFSFVDEDDGNLAGILSSLVLSNFSSADIRVFKDLLKSRLLPKVEIDVTGGEYDYE